MGLQLQRPSQGGKSLLFLSKVRFKKIPYYYIGSDMGYFTGPPEAAQEETQSLETALLDEEVGLLML